MSSQRITPTQVRDCWTTHSFLAERLRHPLRARWPATLTGNGRCASLSATSVSRLLQSQHPSAIPWSGRLQNSRDPESKHVYPPLNNSLAFSL